VTIWPNWVDLIVIIIVVRTCYSGSAQSLLIGVLNLAGVVLATALTVNYSGALAAFIYPWLALVPPTTIAFTVFWLVLIGLVAGLRSGLRVLVSLVKGERIHWFLQGVGAVVGGARGVWWAGLITLSMAVSGFPYLEASTAERSLLGLPIMKFTHDTLVRVTNRLPGAANRAPTLIPAAKHTVKERGPFER
jgi:uncharacterized membrane protein required for colicin V production